LPPRAIDSYGRVRHPVILHFVAHCCSQLLLVLLATCWHFIGV